MKIKFTKIKGLSIKGISELTKSIIEDIKDGKFIMRRWHLHALAFPLVLLANILMFHADSIDATHWLLMPFRSLHEIGIIGRFIIQTIIAFFIAYSVEFIQGLMGANKTEAEVFESDKDALFTVFCFEIGIIIGLIFL